MKLNIIEERKADNYTGDSITYNLSNIFVEQKKDIIGEIFKLKELDPVKIKIEYIKEDMEKVDSFYRKSLSKDEIHKYDNIVFVKIKANINNTRISFTIDFKDNYLRIKADYNENFNKNDIMKIADYLTRKF